MNATLATKKKPSIKNRKKSLTDRTISRLSSTMGLSDRHSSSQALQAGNPASVTQPVDAGLQNLINMIGGQHALRENLSKTIVMLTNRNRAILRHYFGWSATLDDKSSKEIKRKASEKLDELIEEVKELRKDFPSGFMPRPDGDKLLEMVRLGCDSIIKFQKYHTEATKDLESLAEQLPIHSFVDRTPGFGTIGLGQIIGETGNLSNYSNPGKLWKRMGVAPVSCYNAITKDGKPCNLKPKRRRSVGWRIVDSLLKQNRTKLSNGEYEQGYYSKLYWERRAHEIANNPEFARELDEKGREKISKHGDLRARRYVEKRLLKHIWQEWNKDSGMVREWTPESDKVAKKKHAKTTE